MMPRPYLQIPETYQLMRSCDELLTELVRSIGIPRIYLTPDNHNYRSDRHDYQVYVHAMTGTKRHFLSRKAE